jgi:hypothetical protein
VWGVQTFKHYLEPTRFRLVTDHEPLTWLMQARNLTGKHARWGVVLSQFDFDIEHRAGARNQCADVPSRFPLPSTMDNTGARLDGDCADASTQTNFQTDVGLGEATTPSAALAAAHGQIRPSEERLVAAYAALGREKDERHLIGLFDDYQVPNGASYALACLATPGASDESTVDDAWLWRKQAAAHWRKLSNVIADTGEASTKRTDEAASTASAAWSELVSEGAILVAVDADPVRYLTAALAVGVDVKVVVARADAAEPLDFRRAAAEYSAPEPKVVRLKGDGGALGSNGATQSPAHAAPAGQQKHGP